jgi:four helix bundle protein
LGAGRDKMNSHNLEDLQVWKMARELVALIYHELLPHLPDEEKYGLASQIRRAATSIPANISEGHSRYSLKENFRFCYHARGSLDELFTHAIIAHDLGFVPDSFIDPFKEKILNLRKALHGYIRFLRGKMDGWSIEHRGIGIKEEEDEFYLSDFGENFSKSNYEEAGKQNYDAPFTFHSLH